MRVAFNPTPEAATPQQKADLGRLKKLSTEFESFFMNELIKSMRKTVPDGGLIKVGNAENIYRSMQDEQWSKEMSDRGESGLAQSIYNDLSKKYLSAIPAGDAKKTK